MRIGGIIFCVVFVLLAHVPGGWAQEFMAQGSREGNPPCWLPEDLELTDEQLDMITSIQRRYIREIRGLRGDLLNRRHHFRRLLSDPTSEAADIRMRHREVLAVESQIQEKILDYQLEVRQVLTADQFTRWVSRQRPPRPGAHRKGQMGMIP